MTVKYRRRVTADEQIEQGIRVMSGRNTNIPYLEPSALTNLVAYNSARSSRTRLFVRAYNTFVRKAQNNTLEIGGIPYKNSASLIVQEDVVSRSAERRGDLTNNRYPYLTAEGLVLFLKEYNRLFQFNVDDLESLNQAYGERINAKPNSSWPTQRLCDAIVNGEIISANDWHRVEIKLQRLLQTRNVFYIMRVGLFHFRVGKTTDTLSWRLRNHWLFNNNENAVFYMIYLFEKGSTIDCVTFENNFFNAAEKILNVRKVEIETCTNRGRETYEEYTFDVDDIKQIWQILESCFLNPLVQYQGIMKRFTDKDVFERFNDRIWLKSQGFPRIDSVERVVERNADDSSSDPEDS